jgi:hypothetical protein
LIRRAPPAPALAPGAVPGENDIVLAKLHQKLVVPPRNLCNSLLHDCFLRSGERHLVRE